MGQRCEVAKRVYDYLLNHLHSGAVCDIVFTMTNQNVPVATLIEPLCPQISKNPKPPLPRPYVANFPNPTAFLSNVAECVGIVAKGKSGLEAFPWTKETNATAEDTKKLVGLAKENSKDSHYHLSLLFHNEHQQIVAKVASQFKKGRLMKSFFQRPKPNEMGAKTKNQSDDLDLGVAFDLNEMGILLPQEPHIKSSKAKDIKSHQKKWQNLVTDVQNDLIGDIFHLSFMPDSLDYYHVTFAPTWFRMMYRMDDQVISTWAVGSVPPHEANGTVALPLETPAEDIHARIASFHSYFGVT